MKKYLARTSDSGHLNSLNYNHYSLPSLVVITMEESKAMLKHLGLTEYEAKAYIVLIKFGVLTAEKVCELAQIPLPRVYDTITSLQKKGFVIVSRTRPKKFRAVETRKALESFIEIQKKDFDDRIKNLKTEAGSISAILSAIQKVSLGEEEMEDVWTVTKKVNVQKTVFDLMKNSKKEILIFSGDLSWIHDFAPLVRKLARHLKVRVITKPHKGNKEIEKNIRKAEKIGCHVRSGFTENLRAFIFDDEAVALVKKVPIGSCSEETGLPGAEDRFKYKLMEIKDPEITKVIKQNFEFWWNKLA